jgi:hypothetical protein
LLAKKSFQLIKIHGQKTIKIVHVCVVYWMCIVDSHPSIKNNIAIDLILPKNICNNRVFCKTVVTTIKYTSDSQKIIKDGLKLQRWML